jgi:triosephosphate isomerase
MRLNNSSTLISYAFNFLDKAVQNKNSIEIFHGLIRILCICEGNTTEEDGKILSDLHNLLLEMLANLHNRYRHSYR